MKRANVKNNANKTKNPSDITQQTFTCSKIIETLEQGVKYVQS